MMVLHWLFYQLLLVALVFICLGIHVNRLQVLGRTESPHIDEGKVFHRC
jgi:hypothetical protein